MGLLLTCVLEECKSQAISLIHESMDESADESGCAFIVCVDTLLSRGDHRSGSVAAMHELVLVSYK